jgi:hypothetical protein
VVDARDSAKTADPKSARRLISLLVCRSIDSALRVRSGRQSYEASESRLQAMPSLLRLLTMIGVLCAVVYGGLYALAHFVQPKSREMSVSIPPDKFFKER